MMYVYEWFAHMKVETVQGLQLANYALPNCRAVIDLSSLGDLL